MKEMLCILLVFTGVNYCSAQVAKNESDENALKRAIDDYERGAYTKSLHELENITHVHDRDLQVYVHTFMALNYVAIGDKYTAIEQFKKALSIDPDLELDPVIVTPEIAYVLEEAKSEKAYESAGCSCFIPGIGQFMKGEENKGRAIIAASGLTLTGAMITWVVADSKHNHYLSLGPEDVEDMDQAYNDYNRWRKASIITATAFVGIYIYSILDAILSRKSPNNSGAKKGFNILSNGESISIDYTTGL